MTTTHFTGAMKAITDEILSEFSLDNTPRFRADNGTNIAAAFRESPIEVSAKLIDNDSMGPTVAKIDPDRSRRVIRQMCRIPSTSDRV